MTSFKKEYRDDPTYKIVYQAVIDANKDIARKKIINQLIYTLIMVVIIAIGIFVIWNVLGLKEVFDVYNSILE